MHTKSSRASRLRRTNFFKLGAFAIVGTVAFLICVSAVHSGTDAGTSLAAIPILSIGAMMFRAPEGAAGAGGATEAPQFEAPAWAPADKAPEVTGDSIENKLESSTGIIGTLFKNLKTAFTDFKNLWDEKQELSTQFENLTATAQAEKDAHTATKGLLETEKGEHTKTKGEFDKSKKNVERLEKLCDLKGIDKNQVVAPDTQNGGNDVVAQYKKLKADEKAGTVAQGTAHRFYRKNKKAIDEAGE